MMKTKHLQEFQKRMPDDITIDDETGFELTDDEYVSILSWLSYFKEHYKRFGKGERTFVQFPIISKRLRLDFGLYNIPSDLTHDKGAYKVYLSANGKLLNGIIKKNISTKELINTWNL